MNTTQEKKKILVMGATGQQGGAVIRALLADGHRVCGLVRRTDGGAARRLAAQGVELAKGDFGEADSLVRAAEGVDTVFAMTTPGNLGIEVETAQGLTLVDAFRRAGVGHLVFSSVAGADLETGIPHFESKYVVEQALADSGLPYTIMAPVYFMENLFFPDTTSGLAAGLLSLALPGTRPLQQIAAADIGAFAAALVNRREEVFGRRFDIAGDAVTGQEMAATLSDVLGYQVRYEGFSPDVYRAFSEDMARMFAWFDETGFPVDLTALKGAFPEVRWQDFGEWARAQDWTAVLAAEVRHD